MIKVEVKSNQVFTKSGVSARSGKPYSIREQEAYAHIYGKDGKPAAYPVRISIALEGESAPYAPGSYQLDPTTIYVDRFGSLTLGRIKLLPLVAAAPRQQAA